MFTILLVIGSSFIVLGIVKNKKQPINLVGDIKSNSINSLKFEELRERIDHIEDILFHDIPQLSEEETKIQKASTPDSIADPTYESVAQLVDSHIQQEKLNTSNIALDKFALLCQYEKENMKIEEICALLNMNKGEVLLLKNLYKKSHT